MVIIKNKVFGDSDCWKLVLFNRNRFGERTFQSQNLIAIKRLNIFHDQKTGTENTVIINSQRKQMITLDLIRFNYNWNSNVALQFLPHLSGMDAKGDGGARGWQGHGVICIIKYHFFIGFKLWTFYRRYWK